jgi:hypothetical protein
LFQAFIDGHIFLKLFFHMTGKKNEITYNRTKLNVIIRKYNLLLHMARPKSKLALDAWDIVQRSRQRTHADQTGTARR